MVKAIQIENIYIAFSKIEYNLTIPENLRKQGYRNNGDPIGQKNGVGTPKKTDKIIRIRKIKK